MQKQGLGGNTAHGLATQGVSPSRSDGPTRDLLSLNCTSNTFPRLFFLNQIKM